jgi:hypothetical protein
VAAYVGYVNGWNTKLNSTATFGWLGLDDREFSDGSTGEGWRGLLKIQFRY